MRFSDPVWSSKGRLVLACLSLCILISCSSGDNPAAINKEFEEVPVEQLYNEAADLAEKKEWLDAAERFDSLERQYPYSVWATKALLMSAYSQYKLDKYEEAIGALDRFIQLHPGHEDIAYAYYLRSLTFYERISDVVRDQSMTEQALDALKDVVKRFPETDYARDARLKIDLTRDNLAGKEMEVGRYYQRQTEHLAAINRFRNVIEQYQTTVHVPEALHRLTESYLSLGITREAQMAAAVLGHNFPGSDWYQDSYALLKGRNLDPSEESDQKSWLSRLWNSVF